MSFIYKEISYLVVVPSYLSAVQVSSTSTWRTTQYTCGPYVPINNSQASCQIPPKVVANSFELTHKSDTPRAPVSRKHCPPIARSRTSLRTTPLTYCSAIQSMGPPRGHTASVALEWGSFSPSIATACTKSRRFTCCCC